ncbi:hypothetical protein GGR52DRAFT_519387 [Hypoxylon sp. FL1284]|nr:hypothetical protein GGR52DRAFT_519387 [Hypoxylon sp. FL1284]
MKTAAAAVTSLAALAHAAAPDTAYHYNTIITGYTEACRGADTMSVRVTPEAVTWNFDDYAKVYDHGATFCVMENDIHRAPGNWRFAFDTATYSGNVKANATIKSLGTYLGLSASYVTNQPVSVDEETWTLQSGELGDFVVNGTDLGADENGNFEVAAKPNEESWSPCFFSNATTDYFKYQMSHQTIMYYEEPEDPESRQGQFSSGLKLTLAMKWEECEASLDGLSKWGKTLDMGEGWNPYH